MPELDLTAHLHHLPDGGQLLDLCYLGLTTLPESIGQLTGLTSLDVSGNELTALPESISQLTGLTSLDVSGNELTVLPESICQLTHLTSLGVGGNQLTALPESICQLTGLTSLEASFNQLTALPESIGQLTGLTSLDVSGNELTALPESISQLTGLTSLDVSGNELTALPESISQLTHLTSLNVGRNQLTTLPESIGQLTGLTSLDVWSNQLTALPESIGQLTGLTSLEVWSNQLTALPESISQLTGLTSLDISHNELTALPESIGQLTGLTSLEASVNQLTALPESIGHLTQLTSLEVWSNQLTALPESISQLTRLTSLKASFNQLTALPPLPESLVTLEVSSCTTLTNPPYLIAVNGLDAIHQWQQATARIARPWVWRNDILRANAGKFSVSAIVETLAVLAFAGWLLHAVNSPQAFSTISPGWAALWSHLGRWLLRLFVLANVLAIPLLLRTTASEELALDWCFRLIQALHLRKSRGDIRLGILPLKLMALGLGSSLIRVGATAKTLWKDAFTPRSPFFEIPGNWHRAVFCMDIWCWPELVPGMETRSLSKPDESLSVRELQGDYAVAHGRDHSFFLKYDDKLRRAIRSAIAYLCLGPFYLLALVYRLALKSTCVLYIPLLFFMRWPKSENGKIDVAGYLRTLRKADLGRVAFWWSAIIVIGSIVDMFVAKTLWQYAEDLKQLSEGGLFIQLVRLYLPSAVTEVGLWHIARFVSALATSSLFIYAGQIMQTNEYLRAQRETRDMEEPTRGKVERIILICSSVAKFCSSYVLLCSAWLLYSNVRWGELFRFLCELNVPLFPQN